MRLVNMGLCSTLLLSSAMSLPVRAGKDEEPERVAGENGVDARIDLTPVTDGSLNWKYRAVVRNETLVRASISTLRRVPEWVPKEKRADPNANYYLYHSKHGGGSINMLWAETMEDVLVGKLIPYNNEVDPTTGEPVSRGVFDMTPFRIGHISAPNVHVDNENRRFILYFHGFDKGQFEDLPADVIDKAGGLKPEIELAEKHDSYIAVENHGGNILNTIDGLKAFVDNNKSERLGIAFAPYDRGGPTPDT